MSLILTALGAAATSFSSGAMLGATVFLASRGIKN